MLPFFDNFDFDVLELIVDITLFSILWFLFSGNLFSSTAEKDDAG
jgi:hypothetical protein